MASKTTSRIDRTLTVFFKAHCNHMWPLGVCLLLIAAAIALFLARTRIFAQPTITALQSSPAVCQPQPLTPNRVDGHWQQPMHRRIADPQAADCPGDRCDLYTLLDATQQAAMDAAVLPA